MKDTITLKEAIAILTTLVKVTEKAFEKTENGGCCAVGIDEEDLDAMKCAVQYLTAIDILKSRAVEV